MIEEEVWKDIPGYEGLYQASNLGRVRSLNRVDALGRRIRGRVLKPGTHLDGYLMVDLSKGGVAKHYSVHRLILLAFRGESDLDANHRDGDKANNRLSNLEYVTPSENTQHAYDIGLVVAASGEDHSGSRLTEEEVLAIRNLYDGGNNGHTQQELAELFSVSQQQISRIVNNKRWTHI